MKSQCESIIVIVVCRKMRRVSRASEIVVGSEELLGKNVENASPLEVNATASFWRNPKAKKLRERL